MYLGVLMNLIVLGPGIGFGRISYTLVAPIRMIFLGYKVHLPELSPMRARSLASSARHLLLQRVEHAPRPPNIYSRP